jgi:DNA (cytosine-5)-methyltransferase 1
MGRPPATRVRLPELIRAADLFCGAGGTSTGLRQAVEKRLGRRLQLVAVNHWEIAIDTHSANHPDVAHLCESLDNVDPRKIVPGGRLDILVASPECTHHSNARGGKPMSDQSRASAWHVLRWCEALHIENVLIENVTEFQNWGPLDARGRPLKSKRGVLFRQFIETMRALGYRQIRVEVLNAADYGDATTRRRLFIMARKGNRPIELPEPTHAKDADAPQQHLFRKGRLKKWRAAREIIDWSLQGESIFNRKRGPLADNTLRRIFAGLRKYSGLPFVLPNEGIFRGNQPRSTDEPIPTCTSRGAGGVVQPVPLGEFLLPHQHGSSSPENVRDVDAPLPTVTGTSADMFLAQPFLMALEHSTEGHERRTYDVGEPLKTVTGQSAFGLVDPKPFLVHLRGTERSHIENGAKSVDGPVPTLTGGRHVYLAEPELLPLPEYLVKFFGGLHSAPLDEPLPTVTAQYEHYGLARPFLIKYHGSHAGRADGDGRHHDIDEPVPTVDASNRVGLVIPYHWLVPFYGEREGQGPRTHSVDEPMPTVTASRNAGLAEAFIVKYYGQGGITQPITDPLHTITAVQRFGLLETEAGDLQNYGLLLDIRFRMLQPHELAAAMGFPKTYKFKGTRGDMVRQIGNAVPVNTSAALCEALLAHKAVKRLPRRKAA